VRIQVRLFAILRRHVPDLPPRESLVLDVPDGTTVRQTIRQLAIPDGLPMVAMVNSAVSGLDQVLTEGDTLSLFPPVAGG
jgi:molybdopterin synthase sulfur carrier subunit